MYSRDGEMLVSGCDRAVEVWDLAKMKLRLTLDLPGLRPVDVAFSTGKQCVAARFSVSGDLFDESVFKVKIWDAVTGSEVPSNLPSTISDGVCSSDLLPLMYSPNGEGISFQRVHGRIQKLDIVSGRVSEGLRHVGLGQIYVSAYSPDGSRVALVDAFNITIWDTITDRILWEAESFAVACIAFSKDGHCVASGFWNGTISIWDAENGNCLSTLDGHADSVISVAFSPHGRHLASGSSDNTVRIWNFEDMMDNSSSLGWRNAVVSIAISPSKQQILSTSNNSEITICDWVNIQKPFTTRKDAHERNTSKWKTFLRPPGPDTDQAEVIAFSPTGQYFVSVSERPGDGVSTVCIWDAITRKMVHERCCPDRVSALAVSPDCRSLAFGLVHRENFMTPAVLDGRLPRIEIWDTQTRAVELVLVCRVAAKNKGPSPWAHSVTAMAFSNDNEQLSAATALRDTTGGCIVESWSLKQPILEPRSLGRILPRFKSLKASHHASMSSEVTMLRFSPDDKYLETEHGVLRISHTAGLELSSIEKSPPYLYIRDQFLYHGEKMLLMLPLDFKVKCYDIKEDHVAIGFENGKIATFVIDRTKL